MGTPGTLSVAELVPAVDIDIPPAEVMGARVDVPERLG